MDVNDASGTMMAEKVPSSNEFHIFDLGLPFNPASTKPPLLMRLG
jgi:hypothetical protein